MCDVGSTKKDHFECASDKQQRVLQDRLRLAVQQSLELFEYPIVLSGPQLAWAELDHNKKHMQSQEHRKIEGVRARVEHEANETTAKVTLGVEVDPSPHESNDTFVQAPGVRIRFRVGCWL